ncbi:MAG: HU family DNA-binding protein [Myxococcaceae bacterium]|nr:HU family DNA-binding protein [Myxococcaceae bacterium]
MTLTATRLAAKRLDEGWVRCPSCGAQLRLDVVFGWAFTDEARLNPFVEDLWCTGCDAEWERFDARGLVEAAAGVSADTREWLAEHRRGARWLEEAIAANQAVATCFGSFFTWTRPASVGRNPRTGGPVDVPRARLRAFVPSKEFADRVAATPREPDAADPDPFDEPDDELAPTAPVCTTAVDLTASFEVVVAELAQFGRALLGHIGWWSNEQGVPASPGGSRCGPPPTEPSRARLERGALASIEWSRCHRTVRLVLVGCLTLASACACRPPPVAGGEGEALRVSPPGLDFGEVFIGSTPRRALTVTNPNRATVQATVTVPPPFSVTPGELTLGGGAAAEVLLGFSPRLAGVAEASLEVTEPGRVVTVPVRGLGRAALECPAVACTAVAFDPTEGRCTSQRLADGTACTAPESCFAAAECSGGACVGRLASCDDGDPCTLDACGARGCEHPPVECPVTSPCRVAFCTPDAGCQQREVEDGVSCGPSDCATALICLSGECQRRTRPSAALDCSYDDLRSSEDDVCVLTRGAEVRCWGRTGPRFVNGPRKVPAPPGFHFISNHGGRIYGLDSTGAPWRFQAPGVFRRIPLDGGQYPGPVSMSARGDLDDEWLLVGDALGWSVDAVVFRPDDAGLRGVALGDPVPLLLLGDGGVSKLASTDHPGFGEPVARLEAAGQTAVCGHTASSVRCFSREALGWRETLRADAGALVGGYSQTACLGTAAGRVSCAGTGVVFPPGLTRLTTSHHSALCGLTSAGEVLCHAPGGSAFSASGLGDLSTLPLEPVEVPLPEPAVALALGVEASFAATASGIWAWGAHGDGGASPRLVMPAQQVHVLLVLRPFGRDEDVVAWLDRRGRVFLGQAVPAHEGVSQIFGCAPVVGARDEVCGVTTDGGWFWSSWWGDPRVAPAGFAASGGATFLLTDGGVVRGARPTEVSSAARVPLPAAARFVSDDCVALVDGRVFCGASIGAVRQLTGLLPARDVFGDVDGGCALVGTNGVQCWGSNLLGRLANGTAESASPVFVTMPEPVLRLAGSAAHTCALLRSGKVRCWGDNRRGQLGLEPIGATAAPVKVTR